MRLYRADIAQVKTPETAVPPAKDRQVLRPARLDPGRARERIGAIDRQYAEAEDGLSVELQPISAKSWNDLGDRSPTCMLPRTKIGDARRILVVQRPVRFEHRLGTR